MAFALGAAAGSFLGVAVERLPKGRSRCENCKRQLKWWENIPLISFVFLKGKCRTCRSPIPYWLPLIEIAGGMGGVWVIREVGEIGIIGGLGVMLILLTLTWVFFSDLVSGTVPDVAILIGAVGAVIYRLPFTVQDLLWPAAAAGGFFYFLVLITRGRGMGTGDVTLAAFLGLWLGWPKILLAVWLAFILGAVAGLVLIGLKLKRFGQTIPFGPFLIAASIITAIYIKNDWTALIGI